MTIGARVAGGSRTGVLGIQGGNAEYHRLDPASAVVAGVAQTWDVTRQTVVGIAQMISGQRGTADIGGPLRIAELSGQVAQLGVANLISFIAVLSVNLGLINLFPIPILDGGHLLFYLAEAVRGPADPAAGAGIWLPRRIRADREPVRVRDLERPHSSRPVPLGRGPDRLSRRARLDGARQQRGVTAGSVGEVARLLSARPIGGPAARL